MVLGLSAGFSPGPLFALVLSHTLRYGVREGIKIAAAPLLTDLPIILVSTFVLTRLARSGAVLGAVSIAGGLFLTHMAADTFRTRKQDPAGETAAPQSLMKGVMVNALSPHPYLFWLTVGAPTIVKAWPRDRLSAVAFVVGFLGCLVGSKVVLAVLAGRSRRLLEGKPFGYVTRGLGLLIFLYAILLVKDGLVLLGWLPG